MKKYIIEEAKDFISIVCEVSNKDNALILVKELNKISKENNGSSKFHICELIED